MPIPDLGGIVTVLNTPFTESGEVDPGSMRAHVEYALDARCRGVPAARHGE